ncbi:MAG: hypothetical protein HY226_05040 [Candidatus Vogelbacteria bacterium]|nr:hypothetical protein [Candidatus Vogelbacteria bacterium]
MNSESKNKTLIVCNDAGGGEILAAHVSRLISYVCRLSNFYFVITGPARKIFRDRGLITDHAGDNPISPSDVFDKISLIDDVITATSWATSLEIDFIREAKSRKIHTTTYLDHWYNYRERFGYPNEAWTANLPDEIRTGDQYAYETAKAAFPMVKVVLEPNPFFGDIKLRYKEAKNRETLLYGTTVLYASQPLSGPVSYFVKRTESSLDEFEILQRVLSSFLASGRKESFVIRPHPSENGMKFESILNKFKDKINVSISKNSDMFTDLAEAKIVVGVGSMFLVTASMCGIPTVSFIPDNCKIGDLPIGNIVKVNNDDDLTSYFKNYE